MKEEGTRQALAAQVERKSPSSSLHRFRSRCRLVVIHEVNNCSKFPNTSIYTSGVDWMSSSDSDAQRKAKRARKIHRIASAAIAAAVIHAACFFLAVGLYANNTGNPTAGYELYKPAFFVNANLTTTIQNKLVESCPDANLPLFSMQADFTIPDTTTQLSVQGALLTIRTEMFGFVHMNGYYLLFVIFAISFLAQVNVIWEYYRMKKNEKDESFFTEPCAARWFEYALTSPCMITIIASSLLIRDIHTVLLLAAAQGALCQFGFGMECAYSLRVCESPDNSNDGGLIQFRPLPVLPILRTIPKMSQQLWYWSFVPSMLLHVLVWGILITSLLDQTNTKCFKDQPGAPPWIVGILIAQAFLFTLFVLIAFIQAWNLDMIPFKKRKPVSPDDVSDSFVDAFWSYTLLSAIAKAVLGITYVSYVNQFPFYTPELPPASQVLSFGVTRLLQDLS